MDCSDKLASILSSSSASRYKILDLQKITKLNDPLKEKDMLEKERTEIDRLDREIVKLFEERTKMVEQVAEVKLANNKDILDAGREALVIEKVQGYLENPELKEELADLYTEIMRISRGHQEHWMAQQEEK